VSNAVVNIPCRHANDLGGLHLLQRYANGKPAHAQGAPHLPAAYADNDGGRLAEYRSCRNAGLQGYKHD
jgi:hypothetical protein